MLWYLVTVTPASLIYCPENPQTQIEVEGLGLEPHLYPLGSMSFVRASGQLQGNGRTPEARQWAELVGYAVRTTWVLSAFTLLPWGQDSLSQSLRKAHVFKP